MAVGSKWRGQFVQGDRDSGGLEPIARTRRFGLAFLSPELVRRIRTDTQPGDFALEALTQRIDLPLDWSQQEAILS